MAYLTERKYSFVSNALSPDTFAVVDFTGDEGLSQCYRFEVMLVTDNEEIDLGSVIQNPARFTIHRDEGDDVLFHGILSSFEQLNEVDEYVFYRAKLVPKLWWLTLTHHNQVFLNKDVKEMVEAVLKDGGLTALDFEFRLQGQYPKNDYVCQYGETHFNFMSRWLEREGVYYYFEQSESNEKVIFTDTAISHVDSPNGGSLHYSPPSGLAEEHRREIIQGFLCRYNSLPRQIRLKDYNYRKPSLEMTGSAVVDEKGRGEVYYYGEHFRTPEEGNRLANIRSQELLCRKEEFIGDSTVPYIQTGYTFSLQDHYRESFNRKYLTTKMTHEGSQTGYLISGIMKGLSGREEKVYYQNHFTAIPSSVQFRPERTADKPRITGTLNGKIDAAGSGKYAELDDEGRYKVILPFDLSGRKEGKASTWIRMVQPYAGTDHGMHFPLHKDTEVLLTFIEGNPDRPIIAGAAPNPETRSQVTSADQTMAKITTSGGNKIHMEDQDGKQRILLHTPTQGSFVRIGAPNDPEDEKWDPKWPGKDTSKTGTDTEDSWGIHLFTHKLLDIKAEAKNEIILGEETSTVAGARLETTFGSQNEIVIINKNDLILGILTELCLGLMKLEYSNSINRLTKVHNEVTELKNNIAQSHNALVMDHTKLALETNELAAEANKLAQETTNLSQQMWLVAFQTSSLAEQSSLLAGEVAEAKGEQTSAIGERMTVIAESFNAIGDTTDVIGDATSAIGAQTRTIGEATDITGENTMIAGLNLMI